MICRKATVALSDANFLSFWCQSLSFRAQNRGFCAFLAFGTHVFGLPKHKIGVFVRCAEGDEGGGVKLSFFCVISGVNCCIFLLNLRLHWLS